MDFETEFQELKTPNDYYTDSKDPDNKKNKRVNIIRKAALQLRNQTFPAIGRGNKVIRFIWIFTYFVLTLLFVWSVEIIIKKYYSYPTSIKIEIISRDELEFPAVTVCNENPVKRSLIKRLRQFNDLILLEDYVKSSFRNPALNGMKYRQPEKCEGKEPSLFFFRN